MARITIEQFTDLIKDVVDLSQHVPARYRTTAGTQAFRVWVDDTQANRMANTLRIISSDLDSRAEDHGDKFAFVFQRKEVDRTYEVTRAGIDIMVRNKATTAALTELRTAVKLASYAAEARTSDRWELAHRADAAYRYALAYADERRVEQQQDYGRRDGTEQAREEARDRIDSLSQATSDQLRAVQTGIAALNALAPGILSSSTVDELARLKGEAVKAQATKLSPPPAGVTPGVFWCGAPGTYNPRLEADDYIIEMPLINKEKE